MKALRKRAVVLAFVAFGTAACSEGPAATSSQTRITNATDLFQFSILSMTGRDSGRSYTWQNNGARALIDVTPAITSGDALLTVRDASGTVLYQENVRDDIDLLTDPGTPGAWSIELSFDQTYGSFAFTITRQD